ncbi:MAG: haloacid dehalogenase type II [Acidiferrobacterales bacterium]
MSKHGLQDIKACVFDAYGTLFDVHSAVGAHSARLGAQADAVSVTWRNKQLEYTWLRSLMGRHADFWQVTGEALDFALERHGIDIQTATNSGLREALMQAYLKLSPYPEVMMALAELRQRGFRMAILSNGSPAMLEAAVKNAQLQEAFEAVLSVESVGIYKPDPRVYQMAVDQLGLPSEQILFLSSNGWDISGAKSFGFHTFWVNRAGAPVERLGNEPDAILDNLTVLPQMLLE